MIDPDLLGPLMFGAALTLIFMGYPVAFALGGTALAFAVIGINMELFDFVLLQALSQRIFGIMQNYTLLAVPFFILMGMILERTGLAEDLLKGGYHGTRVIHYQDGQVFVTIGWAFFYAPFHHAFIMGSAGEKQVF